MLFEDKVKSGKLINSVIMYKCPYCGAGYEKELHAEDCLNSHNVVFVVYKEKSSVRSNDCWGKTEADYEKIGTYKNYSSVRQYEDAEGYVIEIEELK